MSILQSVLSWLGLERPSASIGLRPHRTIELPVDLESAYKKCLEALEGILGATISRSDLNPAKGNASIEAAFGLVNSERLRISLETTATPSTIIRIEAIYPANATTPKTSLAVETLAGFLSEDTA